MLTISFGFILRVIAGSLVLNLPISLWMCLLIFLLSIFLIASKRKKEKLLYDHGTRKTIEFYSVNFLNILMILSLILSILLFFYFSFFIRPDLKITSLFVILGFFRYFYTLHKNKYIESPTDLLLMDGKLQLIIFLWFIFSLIISSSA